MEEGVDQMRSVTCFWLPQAAKAGPLTVLSSDFVRNSLVVTVDVVPVVLGLSYHRSEGIGDILSSRGNRVDSEPKALISEHNETNVLHDGGVVEAAVSTGGCS